jgi:hypothetical protein
MKSQAVTVVTPKIKVFWNFMPYSLKETYHHIWAIFFLHQQCSKLYSLQTGGLTAGAMLVRGKAKVKWQPNGTQNSSLHHSVTWDYEQCLLYIHVILLLFIYLFYLFISNCN